MTDKLGQEMKVGDLIVYAAAQWHRGCMRIGVIVKYHEGETSKYGYHETDRISTKFFEKADASIAPYWTVSRGTPETTQCIVLDVETIKDEELKKLIKETQASIR